jgi:hypothetical protein
LRYFASNERKTKDIASGFALFFDAFDRRDANGTVTADLFTGLPNELSLGAVTQTWLPS